MSVIKTNICDNCNNYTDTKDEYLIYDIFFWSKKKYESKKVDFLSSNACALMLCSKECVGEYIAKLIDGV